MHRSMHIAPSRWKAGPAFSQNLLLGGRSKKVTLQTGLASSLQPAFVVVPNESLFVRPRKLLAQDDLHGHLEPVAGDCTRQCSGLAHNTAVSRTHPVPELRAIRVVQSAKGRAAQMRPVIEHPGIVNMSVVSPGSI